MVIFNRNGYTAIPREIKLTWKYLPFSLGATFIGKNLHLLAFKNSSHYLKGYKYQEGNFLSINVVSLCKWWQNLSDASIYEQRAT